jgi:hypothetical protein
MGYGWNQPEIRHIAIRVLQASFLVALFGAPFSYYLRHSWSARMAALLALLTGLIAAWAA